MKANVLAAAVTVAMMFVGQGWSFAADPPQGRKGRLAPAEDPLSGFTVRDPVTHRNLAIFPVTSTTPRNSDRFITLDEALRAGTVEIREMGAGPFQPNAARNEPGRSQTGAATQSPSQRRQRTNDDSNDPFSEPTGNDVNKLVLVNRSEKPLYLMPGEVIIGGSQDRTLAHEMVIPADKKPMTIDVFCVEHGRWGHREPAEYAAYLQAATANQARAGSVAIQGNRSHPNQVANDANSGKFVGSVGNLSKKGRIAVQSGEGQGKVWQEVGQENDKSRVQSRSGTFTGNYAEKESVERLDPYLERLREPVSREGQVVGVIVAINGKVESMDVFESTPLFRKLWPKLLKSYALDAVNALDRNSQAKTCSREQAIAFWKEAASGEAKKAKSKGNVAVSQRESERVLLFSAHDHRGPYGTAEMLGGMGGFGGGIHSSAFAK